MRPIRFAKIGNKVCFYYDKSEYRDWYKRNGGLILVSIEKKILTYFMMNDGIRMTISCVNLPIFDGEIQSPEKYLKNYQQ